MGRSGRRVEETAIALTKKNEDVPGREFADSLADELIHNNLDSVNTTVAKTLSPLLQKIPTPPTRKSPRHHNVTVGFDPCISEVAVSPLTKSTATNSSKLKEAQATAVWLQVPDLHKHVPFSYTHLTHPTNLSLRH